ncbi:MAG: hypothetical protein ACK5MI_07125 [Mangrovibacterium sp.]
MKNFAALLSIFVVLFTAGCGNSNSQKQNTAETRQPAATVIKVDELLSKAESLVGKEIVLEGTVTHTCKHSGKRCFLQGEKEDFTIRVEAEGKINGFNRELTGTDIRVKGVLQERRISTEAIDKMEAKVKAEEDGSAESCAAENNNIAKMRKWMTDHHKDYYAVYFLNGTEYEQL